MPTTYELVKYKVRTLNIYFCYKIVFLKDFKESLNKYNTKERKNNHFELAFMKILHFEPKTAIREFSGLNYSLKQLLFSESEKVFKPEVRRQEKYFTPDMNRRRLIDRAKMKSLRMSVVIVAAFLIWWTPYYVMMIIFTFLNPDKNVSNMFIVFLQPSI